MADGKRLTHRWHYEWATWTIYRPAAGLAAGLPVCRVRYSCWKMKRATKDERGSGRICQPVKLSLPPGCLPGKTTTVDGSFQRRYILRWWGYKDEGLFYIMGRVDEISLMCWSPPEYRWEEIAHTRYCGIAGWDGSVWHFRCWKICHFDELQLKKNWRHWYRDKIRPRFISKCCGLNAAPVQTRKGKILRKTIRCDCWWHTLYGNFHHWWPGHPGWNKRTAPTKEAGAGVCTSGNLILVIVHWILKYWING